MSKYSYFYSPSLLDSHKVKAWQQTILSKMATGEPQYLVRHMAWNNVWHFRRDLLTSPVIRHTHRLTFSKACLSVTSSLPWNKYNLLRPFPSQEYCKTSLFSWDFNNIKNIGTTASLALISSYMYAYIHVCVCAVILAGKHCWQLQYIEKQINK